VLHLSRRVAQTFNMVQPDWNGFNLLHTAAARVGALDIGFLPGSGGRDIGRIIDGTQKGEIEVVYLLGADEIAGSHFANAFVIYQGHHGDAGAHRADVVLPGAAYTEKSATYVNTEGRVQVTQKAVFAPGEAKEDWAIIRALSAKLGRTLPFDTLGALRAQMYKAAPQLARIDTVERAGADGLAAVGRLAGDVLAEPFAPAVDNFYMTNPLARASAIMAELSAMKARPPHAQAAE
jgi:NADH-quinone oxidoreductase subunit G